MAKAYIVIQNGQRVVGRFDSKAAAEAASEVLRDKHRTASFEFGKLDKRLFSTKSDTSYTDVDETL